MITSLLDLFHLYLVRRRDRSLSLAAQSLYELVLAEPPQMVEAKPGRTRKPRG